MRASFVITLALGAFACGGSLADESTQFTTGATVDSGASSRRDGGAGTSDASTNATCAPRAGCVSTTRCTTVCTTGVVGAVESDCSCENGTWKCQSAPCVHSLPNITCPPVAPRYGDTCVVPSNVTCNYGECAPSCRCNAQSRWECSQDDCGSSVDAGAAD